MSKAILHLPTGKYLFTGSTSEMAYSLLSELHIYLKSHGMPPDIHFVRRWDRIFDAPDSNYNSEVADTWDELLQEVNNHTLELVDV